MTDTWESTPLVAEVWESSTQAGIEFVTVIRVGESTGGPPSGGAGSNSLDLLYLFFTPQDISGTVTGPIPAGQKVGFDAQTDPDENGWYLSDGAGGVTGTVTPFVTPENLGLKVTAFVTVEDPDTAFGVLADYYDAPVATNYATNWWVGTADGVNFALFTLDKPSLKAFADLVGKAIPPVWNDYLVDEDTQLTKNHMVTAVQTDAGDVTLTMPPHMQVVVPTIIQNYSGANDVIVVEHPSESAITFSQTIPPGEIGIVLPNQLNWEYFRWVQKASELPYTPTTSGDWTEGAPADVRAGLDKLAARSGGGDLAHVASVGAQTTVTEAATGWASAGVNAPILDSAISLPTCAAGDVIEFTAAVTFTNSSGATRQPRPGFRLGSTNVTVGGIVAVGAVANGVTCSVLIEGTIHVLSTSSQRLSVLCSGDGSNTQAQATNTAATETMSSTSSLQITFGTNNATGTQTAQLLSVHVTKVTA